MKNKAQTNEELRQELIDTAMEQIRDLKACSVTDKKLPNTVTKADSIFNGIGKIVKVCLLEAVQREYIGKGESQVAKLGTS